MQAFKKGEGGERRFRTDSMLVFVVEGIESWMPFFLLIPRSRKEPKKIKILWQISWEIVQFGAGFDSWDLRFGVDSEVDDDFGFRNSGFGETVLLKEEGELIGRLDLRKVRLDGWDWTMGWQRGSYVGWESLRLLREGIFVLSWRGTWHSRLFHSIVSKFICIL